MAFGGVFHPVFRPVFDPIGAVVTPPAANWWEAGSAPTPLAVYQPKGASSQAASYLNVLSPGTHDATPMNPPSWDAVAAWGFNAAGYTYLATDITAPLDGALLVRFSNSAESGGQALIGANGGGAYHALGSYWYGAGIYYANGSTEAAAGPALLSGVLAFAGDKVYRDGVESHTISGWRVAGSVTYQIGAMNTAFFFTGNIQTIAIWDTSTGHATWMPEVMAAVALI